MEGNFEIYPAGVKGAAEQQKNISKELTGYVKRLESIRSNLSTRSYGDIRNVLREIENNENIIIKNVDTLEETLSNIIREYENTESRIAGTSAGKGNKVKDEGKLRDKIDQFLKDLIRALKGKENENCSYGGDPINLSTGNFIYNREYLKMKGAYPLSFKMTYNSMEADRGTLGKGWVHNYEVAIRREGSRVILNGADGKCEIFEKNVSGTYQKIDGSKTVLLESQEGFCYQTELEQQYFFDRDGNMIKAVDQNANQLTFSYNTQKQLVEVKNESGQKLCFAYENNLLVKVFDQTGRCVDFKYREGLLVEAADEEKHTFSYEYDARDHLTVVKNPRGILSLRNEYDEKGRVLKQTYPDSSFMELTYDDKAGIVQMTEQNGNKISYRHDERYRSVETAYEDGSIKYVYNDKNQKIESTDKKGNATKYQYDATGNLTVIENPLGQQMQMNYNAHRQMTELSVGGELLWKNEYDRRGNLTRREDALGRAIVLFYNENGKPVEICQPDASKIRLRYDTSGNIVSVMEPAGGETKYEYDAFGNVTASIDGNGNRTEYAYNKRGHIVAVTNAEGKTKHFSYNESGKVTCIEEYDGSRIYREYNDINKPSRIVNQEGNEIVLEYDSMWNLVCRRDPNGAVTRYEYDKLNRLKRIVNPKGAEFSYEYDANGNRTKITDSFGATVKMKYDALNRLVQVEDADSAVSKMEYNIYGQQTRLTDALGNVKQIIYDKAGQKIGVIDAMGNETRYQYQKLGKISEVTDAMGRKTKYDYLPGGLLAKVTYPDGTYLCYTYDANRNVKSKTNQKGYTLTYDYDCMNRIIQVSSSEGQKQRYFYNALGKIKATEDANGNQTWYQYTPTGKLRSVTDSLGNRTEYDYDVVDGLVEISMMNAENQVHQIARYERDVLGHVICAADVLGKKEYYTYDVMGRVTKKTDRDGFVTTYGYTAGGQLERIGYADGKEVKMSYNALKQLVEIQDWLGKTKIEVDALGRPERVTDYKGRETTYTRGALGQRVQMQYPGGRKITYGYDNALHLTSVQDGNDMLQYHYDEYGKMIEKLWPNGVRTCYTYNSQGAIESFSHWKHEELLEMQEFEYDAVGNKVAIRKERQGLPEQSGEYRYFYDELNRLAEVQKDGIRLRRYGYDAFGNRSFQEDTEGRTDYFYDEANQLIRTVGTGGTQDYRYDARGNLTQLLEAGCIRKTYNYDCKNRLQQVTDMDDTKVFYEYNGLGMRVGQQILEQQNVTKNVAYVIDVTKRYHNLLQTIEENEITEYFWDGAIAAEYQKDDVHYYLSDEMGTPLRTVDRTGNAVKNYAFDEFGNEQLEKKNDTFGYTGFLYDEVSETYFAQAREYHPDTARFMARDLVQGMQAAPYTMNTYAYCWNRPTAFVDKDGAFPSYRDVQEAISDAGDAVGDWLGTTVNSAGEVLSDATTTFFNGADYVWDTWVPSEVKSTISSGGQTVLGWGRDALETDIFGLGSVSDAMAYASQTWYGEAFLAAVDFNRTSDGVYHSDPNCWQVPFGYNDFYDYIFDGATSMDKNKYSFTTDDGTNYTIWMWKGDYLNLGAGCETGIYYGDGYHVNSATDTNLYMSIALYDKRTGEQIFSYDPSDAQWWITGFNPAYQDYYEGNLWVEGSIDFSQEPEMWEAFIAEYGGKKDWCFDEENYTAYYAW